MKLVKRHGLVGLLFLIVLFMSIPDVSAGSSRLLVTVDDAIYTDLDLDGLEDDILIDMTLTVCPDAASPRYSEYYLTLRLPSGIEHYALVQLIGKFSELHMRVLWYNSAWESGWYNLDVTAIAYGGSVLGYVETTYVFDPPTGSGVGDPHIEVLCW
ncbi:hypothetical protein EU519_01355 [Candidatus Thorarchaeota archaeon]|nr:MAG: hypothetical protein EU519_01355 [Candidatus Thorarchaeota archaeon]